MEDIFHESFNTIAFNLAKVKLKLGNTFLKFLFVAIERWFTQCHFYTTTTSNFLTWFINPIIRTKLYRK